MVKKGQKGKAGSSSGARGSSERPAEGPATGASKRKATTVNHGMELKKRLLKTDPLPRSGTVAVTGYAERMLFF